MVRSRSFSVLVAALVAVVWLLAFTAGLSRTALVCALLSTALSAALLLTASGQRPPSAALIPLHPRSDSAQFRRELANLCAALKLGVSFCERHPEADPDALLQHVEEMGDAILVFVNQTARPVRLRARAHCVADTQGTSASAP